MTFQHATNQTEKSAHRRHESVLGLHFFANGRQLATADDSSLGVKGYGAHLGPSSRITWLNGHPRRVREAFCFARGRTCPKPKRTVTQRHDPGRRRHRCAIATKRCEPYVLLVLKRHHGSVSDATKPASVGALHITDPRESVDIESQKLRKAKRGANAGADLVVRPGANYLRLYLTLVLSPFLKVMANT